MRVKIFFIIFLFVINLVNISNVANAKQTEEFINFLSEKIYKNCRGKDLIIKSDSLLDLRDGISLKVIGEDIVKWPDYSLGFIKEILEIFSSREKFAHFTIIGGKKEFIDTIIPQVSFSLPDGTEKKILFDGRDILRCGDNVLDINGTDYYWNNEKIEVPRNIEINQSISDTVVGGDVAQTVNTGDNVVQVGIIDKSFVWQGVKSFIFNIVIDIKFYIGITFTIILSFVLKILFKLRIKRKR